jgi:uncharacterized membrane protein YeaQ/YmgE (transglycosylase-associated protein family)
MKEIVLGVTGPVVVAAVAWVLMARTHRAHPERLMPLMIAAFAAKLVVLGAYFIVMLRAFALRPVPFTWAFVGAVIALYSVDTFRLRRLLR